MADRVLVTGGAGYIGAHACKALARAGYEPVVFDNLSTGWAGAVKWGPLVKGDLMDRASIDAALAEYRPVAVMHFAALSLVGESMTDPARYWRVNTGGALNLLEACAAAGVSRARAKANRSRCFRLAPSASKSAGTFCRGEGDATFTCGRPWCWEWPGRRSRCLARRYHGGSNRRWPSSGVGKHRDPQQTPIRLRCWPE